MRKPLSTAHFGQGEDSPLESRPSGIPLAEADRRPCPVVGVEAAGCCMLQSLCMRIEHKHISSVNMELRSHLFKEHIKCDAKVVTRRDSYINAAKGGQLLDL